MKVHIAGVLYRVHFDHKTYDPYLMIEGKYGDLAISDIVRCVIRMGPGDAPVVGVCERMCSAKDIFNLHRGRREALAGALREGQFSQADREVFWAEFVKTLPKKSQVQSLLARIKILEQIVGTFQAG